MVCRLAVVSSLTMSFVEDLSVNFYYLFVSLFKFYSIHQTSQMTIQHKEQLACVWFLFIFFLNIAMCWRVLDFESYKHDRTPPAINHETPNNNNLSYLIFRTE